MKKQFFTIILTLILAAALNAQDRDFMPYVSQIKAESRNNLIRLSWVDSPDVRGPVYVFRSARPFSGSISANIRPVVVRYGQQYYVDDTDDIENLYYFVAASDVSGQRYDVIIPRMNSTSVNLAQLQSQDDSEEPPPVVQAPPASAEPIPGISNLRATRDGEKVVITYDYSGPPRRAILYRSMQPVSRPADLLNAVIVRSGISSPFVDFPVPGFTWYYAVIYEDEVSSGNMGIRPGINATTSAVIIIAQRAVEQPLRPIPLPILTLHNTMPEGFFRTEIPRQRPLSAESANMLKSTRMPSKAPLSLKNPRVFIVDLEAPTGGEDSALFQIISEFFVRFEWGNALVSLQHYLSLPRSSDIEARARFYLGQTLYYTGNYREALMEFLSFRPLHNAEANNWIEAVLTAMVY